MAALAVVVALVFRQLYGYRRLRLTAEDHLCDNKGNRDGGQQKAQKLHCWSGFDCSLISFLRSFGGGLLGCLSVVMTSVGAANENKHSHDRGDHHSGTDAQDAVRSTEVSRVQVLHGDEPNGV